MINILLEKNVTCKTRDGVTLRADVYRPNEEGTFPVLLTRLPYGKDDPFFSHRYIDTNRLVQAGFVVIVQDVRGRFNSDGDFYPFKYEAEDGYDAVEWAAQLPYSNGEVGMFGLSYYGFTQLLAAKEQPAHLKAIFPTQTLNDLKENMIYQNGVVKLASFKTWILESMVPDLLRRSYGDQPEVLQEKMGIWLQAYDNLANSYTDTLADGWPILQELGVAEEFFEIYQLAEDDPVWDLTKITDKYEDITYPAIHVAGWYDSLLKSTLANYENLAKKQDTTQRLIVGPWTHGDFGAVQGEIDYGMQASEHLLEGKEDLTSLHIRWFNHWLKGEANGVADEAAVKLFVMGDNQWRDEKEWPLARTKYVPYYLHASGDLSHSAPKTTNDYDSFIHDHDNLVPTTGGQTLFKGVQTTGPRNQADLEEREDVLVYSTPVLEKRVEVTGPIQAKLWVKSQAVETTFTAKLVDVFPDGRAINLTDGISITTDATTENAVEIEIDLWATSNAFLPGHQIRVEIASSNHPQFDPVKSVNETGEEITKVKQTVYHDKNRESHIVLPMIEG